MLTDLLERRWRRVGHTARTEGSGGTNLYTDLKGKCLTLFRTNLIQIIHRRNFYFTVNTVNVRYLG
jgi:hypothetical protein